MTSNTRSLNRAFQSIRERSAARKSPRNPWRLRKSPERKSSATTRRASGNFSCNAKARLDPMNPAPPVTKILRITPYYMLAQGVGVNKTKFLVFAPMFPAGSSPAGGPPARRRGTCRKHRREHQEFRLIDSNPLGKHIIGGYAQYFGNGRRGIHRIQPGFGVAGEVSG